MKFVSKLKTSTFSLILADIFYIIIMCIGIGFVSSYVTAPDDPWALLGFEIGLILIAFALVFIAMSIVGFVSNFKLKKNNIDFSKLKRKNKVGFIFKILFFGLSIAWVVWMFFVCFDSSNIEGPVLLLIIASIITIPGLIFSVKEYKRYSNSFQEVNIEEN